MPQDPPAGDDAAQPPARPMILSGEEIFDEIMSRIEPELVLKNLDHLDEKYEGESAEERKARYARYQAAFEEYRKLSKMYFSNLDKEVGDYCRAKLQKAEQESREREKEKIEELEALFA